MLAVMLLSPLCPQEKVKEEVTVKWWVLPLFAVDQKENSIRDLQGKDIQLYMDNKKIKDFILYRRDFNVAESTKKIEQQKPLKETPTIAPEKKNMIFLLFDRVLSRAEAMRQAKIIAKKIVTDSAPGNRFVIMTINTISGLNYIDGPLQDKKKINDIIRKKVKEKFNKRYFKQKDFIAVGRLPNVFKGDFHEDRSKADGRNARLTPQEIFYLASTVHKLLKGKSMSFFDSFESFYYNLNSIKDNKFIYLFTEGISMFQRKIEKGNFYNRYFTQISKLLGRSGSVVFIINPSSAEKAMTLNYLDPEDTYHGSGKDTLTLFAKESGGKYMQGSKERISKVINNFHRAYYEVSFPDSPDFKGDFHRIKIKSNRKGVKIHTLGTVERNKTYAEMNEIEKEILVLNLISQNPLYETNIAAKGVKVLNVAKDKREITYKVQLPADYLHKKLDLYKVLIAAQASGTKIEKETLIPRKRKFKVQFTADEVIGTDFVLVNPAAESALIYGPGIYDEDIYETEILTKGKALGDRPGYREKMEKYLAGAAGYCEVLKKAAFHCYCKEKIVETYNPLKAQSRFLGDLEGTRIQAVDVDHQGVLALPDNSVNKPDWVKQIKKYVFDYQLVSSKGEVEERRNLLSNNSKTKIPAEKISDMIFSFLTENAVFGPVTMLAAERQDKFNFRLLEYEKRKGRRFAVIEAVPRTRRDVSFAYGKVWIDTEDYSVGKISIDPRSIKGYKKLLQLAKYLRTRLVLNCEIEYDKINKGIRLPTEVVISENYKGGPVIRGQRGSKGWQRNMTCISYTDYRFFDVEAEVESSNTDKK